MFKFRVEFSVLRYPTQSCRPSWIVSSDYYGSHDDVINWKHFPRYWPFVRGIHRSPVNSPDKGQWRGALMFSLICAWINGWVNNREADDVVMIKRYTSSRCLVITGFEYVCYQKTSVKLAGELKGYHIALKGWLGLASLLYVKVKTIRR